MIPDYIIDKAVAAAGDNWVLVFDWEHDKLYAQVHAALEAVAADIWDEGERAGYIHGQHDTHRFDPGPDYTETPNPYRNEHA